MERHEKLILQTYVTQPSERKLDKKKRPQNTSRRAQFSSMTITIVTNLDKQAFACVAKFGEKTLQDAKPLRDQNLPSLQRTNLLSQQLMQTIYVRFPLKRRLHKASAANLPCTTVPTRKARSVRRLATSWTVRGSNPGDGGIFRTRPDRTGPTQPPVQRVPRLFPRGQSGRNVALTTQPI
jgi:hypothetical protein